MPFVMNRKQKILGYWAVALFFVSVFFAPWRTYNLMKTSVRLSSSQIVFSAVFYPAPVGYNQYEVGTATLVWPQLVFTWIAIAIAYAGLFFLVGSQQGAGNVNKKQEHVGQ